MNKKKINFHFWAMGALGKGISGSDRIFIELAARWSKKYPVMIYVWEEGYRMCEKQDLGGSGIKYEVSSMEPWKHLGFVINYFARILESIRIALTLKMENDPSTIIYSASEFWMDSLPCVVLKIRYPKITWVATWFQTAPNPFIGFAEGKREEAHRFKALLYWLAQLLIKPLISKFANKVIVNNEDEKKRFPEFTKKGNTIVLIGAVRLAEFKKYLRKHPRSSRKYDAVFQGRLHPQKGVVELVDIWKEVVKKKPDAKLAVVGDGPLMEDVQKRVRDLGLKKNIKLFGHLFDGLQKYKIFSQSKVVVHPAFYDSGGMAATEAMAFGSPCVGFNLKAYESYYPKGMIKVGIGDLKAFAREIIRLLENKEYRDKMTKEGLKMIEENRSWDKRAKDVLNAIING